MANFTIESNGLTKTAAYVDDWGKKFSSGEMPLSTPDSTLYGAVAAQVRQDAQSEAYSETTDPDGTKTSEAIRSDYAARVKAVDSAWRAYSDGAAAAAVAQASSPTADSSLDIFRDDNIMAEYVYGAEVSEDGTVTESEGFDVQAYLKKFGAYEQTVMTFGGLLTGDLDITRNGSTATAVDSRKTGFDRNGDIPKGKFKCPWCGKEVDQLLQNGYCSKKCAAQARLSRAQSSISAAGEKTMKIINKVKEKLSLLDMALDLVSGLPEMIEGKVRLPKEYADYVELRIDWLFVRLKYYVNVLMIMKNEALMELLKKVKFGDLDARLQAVFAPVKRIIDTAAKLQAAMNSAADAAVAALKAPESGLSPQSYGFLATAKSVQVPEYASKLIIEIVPSANLQQEFHNRLNNINYEAIETITKVSLPPITEAEYFLDPAAFKLRWALSQDNAPRLKKLQQYLESLVVFGPDTFPRWKRLKLTNVWYVVSILTGWGPTSRKVFGDFVFHAPM